MVVVVPGLLAFCFGCSRSARGSPRVPVEHHPGDDLPLLLAFIRNDFGFRRNNCSPLQGHPRFSVQRRHPPALFVLSICALIAASRSAGSVTSKLGKVLVAIRDAESRTRFLGYRVESYKLFVFTLSACMAGVAGALYVPQVGIINPGEFAPGNSIEAVIWVAVGGRGTLVGAALGAVAVNYAKTVLPPGRWRRTGCSCSARCSSG